MGPNCFLPPLTLLERKYTKYWLSDQYTICHDEPQTNLDGDDDYSPKFKRKKKESIESPSQSLMLRFQGFLEMFWKQIFFFLHMVLKCETNSR